MTPDRAPVKASALLQNLLRDAVEMVNSGFASAADIDTALMLGAGHPQGPFAYLAGLPEDDLPADLKPAGDNPVGVAPGDAPQPCTEATPARWAGPVGVLGTGHMAAGIVECAARAGRQVKVLSRSDESSARLMREIVSSFERAVTRHRLDAAAAGEAIARIACTKRAADLAECPLAIEAVAESLAIKHSVLRAVHEVLPPTSVIATNTSSYQVAEVGQEIAERPVIALHFFNPAPAMKLVEIVVPSTEERTRPAGQPARELSVSADAFVRELGKVPVTCGDERGFIVNRLLIPYLNDAVAEVERGVDPGAVDTAVQEQAAHRMGPLALIDLIGVDVTVAALNSIHESVRTQRTAPRQALLRLLDRGDLGRKTGRGFFSHHG